MVFPLGTTSQLRNPRWGSDCSCPWSSNNSSPASHKAIWGEAGLGPSGRERGRWTGESEVHVPTRQLVRGTVLIGRVAVKISVIRRPCKLGKQQREEGYLEKMQENIWRWNRRERASDVGLDPGPLGFGGGKIMQLNRARLKASLCCLHPVDAVYVQPICSSRKPSGALTPHLLPSSTCAQQK